MSVNRLRNRLQALDGKSYKAYKDLRGCHQFADFTLHIDYVQGDPFAAPSRVRVEMPQAIAQFPTTLYNSEPRRIALEDYLIREFENQLRTVKRSAGSGKSGLLQLKV